MKFRLSRFIGLQKYNSFSESYLNLKRGRGRFMYYNNALIYSFFGFGGIFVMLVIFQGYIDDPFYYSFLFIMVITIPGSIEYKLPLEKDTITYLKTQQDHLLFVALLKLYFTHDSTLTEYHKDVRRLFPNLATLLTFILGIASLLYLYYVRTFL